MATQFYGMGEVGLVGTIVSEAASRATSEGGHGACGSDDGESWTLSSRLSGTGYDPRSSSTSNIGQDGSVGGACPTSLELQDLRSRLEIATRLLADRDETIETLASELTTFKSLYKEAILETHSLECAPPAAANPATPEPPPAARLVRTYSLISSGSAHRRFGLTPDDSNDDEEEEEEEDRAVSPNTCGAASPAAVLRAPMGRFYSWRDRSGRKLGPSLLQPQQSPQPSQLLRK